MTARHRPIDLRAEVARTLSPVRPLRRPGRRAFAFVALGAIWLVLVPIAWGVRYDAPVLGFARLWLLSMLQVAAAAVLLRQVLAESIPGRLGAPQRAWLWAGGAAALVLGVTALTFLASPTHVPTLRNARYLYVCSTRTFALGLPPLLLAGWLLHRGLIVRPILAGLLAGLGAGLLADSSWRVFCEVSDPHHVLTAHAGGIAALCLLGVLSGGVTRVVTRGSTDVDDSDDRPVG